MGRTSISTRAATTPSSSDGLTAPPDSYITRERAAEIYTGDAADIFQGDIFERLTLMNPLIGHQDTADGPAIVISHDCEFTKVGRWGPGYRLLVAPLREVAAFDRGNGEPGQIRKNGVRFLFYLPQADPLDDEYAVDLTLIQPVTAAELLESKVWTSLGPGLKPALQGALIVFLSDRRPKVES